MLGDLGTTSALNKARTSARLQLTRTSQLGNLYNPQSKSSASVISAKLYSSVL